MGDNRASSNSCHRLVPAAAPARKAVTYQSQRVRAGMGAGSGVVCRWVLGGGVMGLLPDDDSKKSFLWLQQERGTI